MNQDGSNPHHNQVDFEEIKKQSETTRKIDELSTLKQELEYFQNKNIEKNTQILKETLEHSKKKDEIRKRFEAYTMENSNLKNRIKELQNSIITNNAIIEDTAIKMNELNQKVPLIEKQNLEIFEEVNKYLISNKIIYYSRL